MASHGQHRGELPEPWALRQDTPDSVVRSSTKCEIFEDKLLSSPQKGNRKVLHDFRPVASVQGEEYNLPLLGQLVL